EGADARRRCAERRAGPARNMQHVRPPFILGRPCRLRSVGPSRERWRTLRTFTLYLWDPKCQVDVKRHHFRLPSSLCSMQFARWPIARSIHANTPTDVNGVARSPRSERCLGDVRTKSKRAQSSKPVWFLHHEHCCTAGFSRKRGGKLWIIVDALE